MFQAKSTVSKVLDALRQQKSDEALQMFISCQKNVKDSQELTSKDEFGNSVLHLAASCGAVELIKVCLTAGPFAVDSMNSFGQTSLSLAIKAVEPAAVSVLLEGKADVNLRTTVRVIASTVKGDGAVGSIGLAEFSVGPGLVDRGTEFNVELAKASVLGLSFTTTKPPFVVDYTFSQAAAACISPGDTLLFVQGKDASQLELCNVQSLMRQRPVWLRFRKGEGLHRTPLQLAAYRGDSPCVAAILERQASVNDQDEFSFTALDLAVQQGHYEVAKQLLYANAEQTVTIRKPDGAKAPFRWPLHWKRALINGDPDLNVWKLGGCFQTIVQVSQAIPFFQKMFNQSIVRKKTRDRRDGGRFPRWMEVVNVELNANAPNLREYQQRKLSLLLSRKTSEMAMAGGLKNDMDWADALTLLGIDAEAIMSHKGAVEEYLFHGTTPEAVHAIAKSDFRLNLSGKRMGSLYGPGLYLAESVFKSDEYTDAEGGDVDNGLRPIIVCRVLLGKYYYTAAVKPDVNQIMKKIKCGEYDSVVGDREKCRGTFREFIVYDDDQVYPEWIVWYRRRFDKMPDDAAIDEKAKMPLDVGIEQKAKPQLFCCATVADVAPTGETVKIEIPAEEVFDDDEEDYKMDLKMVAVERASGGPVNVVAYDGRVFSTHVDFESTRSSDVKTMALKNFYTSPVPDTQKVKMYLINPSVPKKSQKIEAMTQNEHEILLIDLPGMEPNLIFLLGSEQFSWGLGSLGIWGASESRQLKAILETFKSADVDKSGDITKGELRVLLWQMHLTDAQLDVVFKKFDAKKDGVIDFNEICALLGPAVMKAEDVETNAEQWLVDFSGQIIKQELERSTRIGSAFKGEELAAKAEGGKLGDDKFQDLEASGGTKKTSRSEACDRSLGCILGQGAGLLFFWGILILGLVNYIADFMADLDQKVFLIACGGIAGVALLGYWSCGCCTETGQAMEGQTVGLDAVMAEVERVSNANYRFQWYIRNYHYEGHGKHQRQITTSEYSLTGEIPCKDVSETTVMFERRGKFIPDTSFSATHIHCSLEREPSTTNYERKYNEWIKAHTTDTRQEFYKIERCDEIHDIMAVWVEGSKPCYLNPQCHFCAHVLLCGPCFLYKSARALGHQDLKLIKKWQDLPADIASHTVAGRPDDFLNPSSL